MPRGSRARIGIRHLSSTVENWRLSTEYQSCAIDWRCDDEIDCYDACYDACLCRAGVHRRNARISRRAPFHRPRVLNKKNKNEVIFKWEFNYMIFISFVYSESGVAIVAPNLDFPGSTRHNRYSALDGFFVKTNRNYQRR